MSAGIECGEIGGNAVNSSFVKRDGRVPHDMIEVAGRSGEEVVFIPAGGGFQYRMPVPACDDLYRAIGREEYVGATPNPATFDIDGTFGPLPGYTYGHRWNGWAR